MIAEVLVCYSFRPERRRSVLHDVRVQYILRFIFISYLWLRWRCLEMLACVRAQLSCIAKIHAIGGLGLNIHFFIHSRSFNLIQ